MMLEYKNICVLFLGNINNIFVLLNLSSIFV